MKDFLVDTDIIKRTSEKLNIEYEKVEYVYLFLISYLSKLTNLKDKVSIIIPHLGIFYIKTAHLRKRINILEARSRRYNLSNSEAKKLEILKNQLEIVSKDYDPLKSKNRNHYNKNKFRSKYKTNGMNIEELENWQNEEKE